MVKGIEKKKTMKEQVSGRQKMAIGVEFKSWKFVGDRESRI